MQCSDLGGKVKIFQLDKKLSVSASVNYPNIFTPIMRARGRGGGRGVGKQHLKGTNLKNNNIPGMPA